MSYVVELMDGDYLRERGLRIEKGYAEGDG